MPAAAIYDLALATNPKEALIKAVGDLSKVSLFSGRVLVAIYISPQKTKGGIILTDNSKREDVYQGSVGLVLKKGKLAFRDDDQTKFHGQDVQPGEWVVFTPGDAKRTQINGVDCRIVEDTTIHMVVDDPSIVTHYQ